MTVPLSLVIDASFALRVILPGEQQERLVNQVGDWLREGHVLCAPMLWHYEITSAVCRAVCLKALNIDEGREALALIDGFRLRLVPPDRLQAEAAYAWTLRLSRGAAYDSYYLALAESLACDLWTADRRLHNAVSLPWVHLVD